MTERKTPAKNVASRKAEDELEPKEQAHDSKPKGEASEQAVDPRVGSEVEVTPLSGGDQHSVNPPLAKVEEYQSVGVDPEFLAGQTVEPDFDKAEKERGKAADRDYLDSRTRNLP